MTSAECNAPTKGKSTPLMKGSFWKCATQMTEMTTLLTTAASVVGCGLGYAVASALKIAPQKQLIPATAGLFLSQMVGIKLIANGDLTPSNRRSAAVMEAWMRRLDAFVYAGADGTGGAGVFLTPFAVVTGATSGLGEQSAENLAACGWKVVIACRDMAAAERARVGIVQRAQQRLRRRYRSVTDDAQKARVAQLLVIVHASVTVAELDTNDIESVKKFAAVVREIENTAGAEVEVNDGSAPSIKVRHDGLRLLMNNAGLFLPGYRQWSSLGVQTMFSINYAGPAYLTHLIMRDVINPRVKSQASKGSSADTAVVPFRTVNLGSCANLWALGDLSPKSHEEAVGMMRDILKAVADPSQNTKNNDLVKDMGDTYGISKLGMIALAHNTALESKANGTEPHVTAFSVHPGGVRTPIMRHLHGLGRFMVWTVLTPIVFKVTKYGASNQTYLSLVLLDEQRKSDVLTRAVIAAAGKDAEGVRDLGQGVIASARAASGSFLIDAGVAKSGGAVSCVTNPDVFAEFKVWTDNFIEKVRN